LAFPGEGESEAEADSSFVSVEAADIHATYDMHHGNGTQASGGGREGGVDIIFWYL
jgi:hypothetical protein